VKANAWHHRSDAMVSLAVLVALLGSMRGYPIMDPLCGVLVSAVIGKQVSDVEQTDVEHDERHEGDDKLFESKFTASYLISTHLVSNRNISNEYTGYIDDTRCAARPQ
jgi:Cation efflux family